MRYEIAEFIAESMNVEIEEDYFDDVLEQYTFALIFDEFDRKDFIDNIRSEIEYNPTLLDMFIEDDFISPIFSEDKSDMEFNDNYYIFNLKENHEGIDIIVY